ncbi:1196_t:CDS:2, partial [Paraglomus occultum]
LNDSQQDNVQIDDKAVEELNDSQQDNVQIDDKAVEELNDDQQDNVQIDDKAVEELNDDQQANVQIDDKAVEEFNDTHNDMLKEVVKGQPEEEVHIDGKSNETIKSDESNVIKNVTNESIKDGKSDEIVNDDKSSDAIHKSKLHEAIENKSDEVFENKQSIEATNNDKSNIARNDKKSSVVIDDDELIAAINNFKQKNVKIETKPESQLPRPQRRISSSFMDFRPESRTALQFQRHQEKLQEKLMAKPSNSSDDQTEKKSPEQLAYEKKMQERLLRRQQLLQLWQEPPRPQIQLRPLLLLQQQSTEHLQFPRRDKSQTPPQTPPQEIPQPQPTPMQQSYPKSQLPVTHGRAKSLSEGLKHQQTNYESAVADNGDANSDSTQQAFNETWHNSATRRRGSERLFVKRPSVSSIPVPSASAKSDSSKS